MHVGSNLNNEWHLVAPGSRSAFKVILPNGFTICVIGRAGERSHHEGPVFVRLANDVDVNAVGKPGEFLKIGHHPVVAGYLRTNGIAQKLLG